MNKMCQKWPFKNSLSCPTYIQSNFKVESDLRKRQRSKLHLNAIFCLHDEEEKLHGSLEPNPQNTLLPAAKRTI